MLRLVKTCVCKLVKLSFQRNKSSARSETAQQPLFCGLRQTEIMETCPVTLVQKGNVFVTTFNVNDFQLNSI